MYSGSGVVIDAFVAHLMMSCVVVSVHSSMTLSIGMRDRASASILAFPGLYLITNLKSASSATQRCVVAFSLAVVSTYVSGLLSVYTVNELA